MFICTWQDLMHKRVHPVINMKVNTELSTALCYWRHDAVALKACQSYRAPHLD